MRIIILALFFFGMVSCKTTQKVTSNPVTQQSIEKTPAELIIDETINAHGGELYETAHYNFVFRNKNYSFKNNYDSYTYEVRYEKDGNLISDTLSNSGFTRTINNEKMILSESDQQKYGSSVNSVIYFATLPHKLKDKAVRKKNRGLNIINGQSYHVIEVTFTENGGGQDHDDTFYYWINEKNDLIDYLAYNYKVGKGGVRFRTAYNRRTIGGVVFQDYVNYKADVGTPLADLPSMWERNKLIELSRIETEKVLLIAKN